MATAIFKPSVLQADYGFGEIMYSWRIRLNHRNPDPEPAADGAVSVESYARADLAPIFSRTTLYLQKAYAQTSQVINAGTLTTV